MRLVFISVFEINLIYDQFGDQTDFQCTPVSASPIMSASLSYVERTSGNQAPNQNIFNSMYSRTSMARTPLEP